MAIVRSLTAERMLAIEAAAIIDGDIVGDDLVLRRHDGTLINAGNVRGPEGPMGVVGEHSHSQYLARDGSTTMTGNLVMSDGALIQAISSGDGANQPSLIYLSRDARPEISIVKAAGAPDKKKWLIYIAGDAGENTPNGTSLTFLAQSDADVGIAALRMYRDGRMGISADPIDPFDVPTKRYTIGVGGTMDANATVPSSATGQTRLKYKEAFTTWGGVTRSGDSLVAPIAGLYRLAFNGSFGTHGSGVIRLVSIGSDTNPTPTFATGVLVGAHVDPTAGSAGYGAILSGSGVVTLAAGQKLSLWARQDAGVSLAIEANLSIQLIRTG